MSGLRVAVQMDPMESVDIDGDSTFVLMLEAQRRGHALWHYNVREMWLEKGALNARLRPVTVRREAGNHFTFGPAETMDLAAMDVVLMRQDPPFDMGYITATHLLQHIHPRTLVVNDPAAVRNAPEKLLVMEFPDLMPPTLIAWDRTAIREFRARHKDIIVKPLYGNGGILHGTARPSANSAPATRTSSSSRSMAMAAWASSASSRMTRISAPCSTRISPVRANR